MVEGAIDMVAGGTDGVVALDFKTDVVARRQHGDLESLYSAQLKEYLVRRSVCRVNRDKGGIDLPRSGRS